MSAVGIKTMPYVLHRPDHNLTLMDGDVGSMSNSSDAASHTTMPSPQQSPSLTPIHDASSPDVVPGTPEVSNGVERTKFKFCDHLANEAMTVYLEDETSSGTRVALKACNSCILSIRSNELLKKLVLENAELKEFALPLTCPDEAAVSMQPDDSGHLQLLEDPLPEEGDMFQESDDQLINFLDDERTYGIQSHSLSCACRECQIARDIIEPTLTGFTSDFSILPQSCESIFTSSTSSSLIANFPLAVDDIDSLVDITSSTAEGSFGNSDSNYFPDLLQQARASVMEPDRLLTQGSRHPKPMVVSSNAAQMASPTPSYSNHQPWQTASRISSLHVQEGVPILNSSSARKGGTVPSRVRSRSMLETHLTANPPPSLPMLLSQVSRREFLAPVAETTSASRSSHSRGGRKSQRGSKGRGGRSNGRGVRGGGVTKGARGGKNSRGGRGQGSQGRVKQTASKRGGDRKNMLGTSQRGATGGRAGGNSRGAGSSRRAGASGAAQSAEDHQRANKFFRCKACNRTFNNWREVDMHQKSEECDYGVLICRICDQRFRAADIMYKHYMQDHNGTY